MRSEKDLRKDKAKAIKAGKVDDILANCDELADKFKKAGKFEKAVAEYMECVEYSVETDPVRAATYKRCVTHGQDII